MAFPYKVNPITSLDTASNFGIISLNVSKSGVGLMDGTHALTSTSWSTLVDTTQHWELLPPDAVLWQVSAGSVDALRQVSSVKGFFKKAKETRRQNAR